MRAMSETQCYFLSQCNTTKHHQKKYYDNKIFTRTYLKPYDHYRLFMVVHVYTYCFTVPIKTDVMGTNMHEQIADIQLKLEAKQVIYYEVLRNNESPERIKQLRTEMTDLIVLLKILETHVKVFNWTYCLN